jgi:hypothetical protein
MTGGIGRAECCTEAGVFGIHRFHGQGFFKPAALLTPAIVGTT